jgi:hypothetical protein
MVVARILARISGHSLLKGWVAIFACLIATYLGERIFHQRSLHNVQNITIACKKGLEDAFDKSIKNFESFFVATQQDWPKLFSQTAPSPAFLEAAKNILTDDIYDLVCIDASGKITYSLGTTFTDELSRSPVIKQLIEQVAITLMPTIAPTFFMQDNVPIISIGFPYVRDKKYQGTIIVSLQSKPIESLIKKYAGQSAVITVAQTKGERGTILFSSKAFDNRQFLLFSRPLFKRIFNGEFGASFDLVHNEWVYNARDFVVPAGWGLEVVLTSNIVAQIMVLLRYMLWVIGALLLLLTLFVLRSRILHVSSWLYRHASALFFVLLAVGFLASTWLCCRYIRSYFSQRADTYKKNVASEQYNMQYATSLIVEHNYHLQSVVHTTARDLNTHHLKFSDWRAYSRKIIPTLSSTNYSGFGISYIHNSKNSESLKTAYILTRNNVASEGTIERLTFGQDLKKMTQAGWIRRIQQPEFGTDLYYVYAEPFTDGQISGFVWATVPYHYVIDIIQVLGKDRAAQALAFDLNGVLIYHPNVELVRNSITISAAAPEIQEAVKKALQGESGILDLPHQNSLFMYESLPSLIGASASQARWSIGVMYNKSEFLTATPEMHRSIVLATLFFILTLVFGAALLMGVYTFSMSIWFIFAYLYCFLLLLEIGTLIVLNYGYLTDVYPAGAITSKLHIIKAQEARERVLGKRVVPILTKLTIQFMDVVSPNEIHFSALVSQTIDRSQFPQALLGFTIKNKSGPLIIKEVSRHRVGEKETVLYMVQGTIHQISPNYAQAPFDIQRVSIELMPLDQEEQAFLALDADGYERLSPASKPGMSAIFEINRYVIEKSYFTYQSNRHNLTFALILKRNLLSVLLESLLPLMVILITIFFMTLVSMFAESKKVNMIAVISGLFFSLILLHQKYRTTLASAAISFLEMFIVVAYASLAYAYFDAVYLLTKTETRPYKALLYWPIIMTYLLVATLHVFG